MWEEDPGEVSIDLRCGDARELLAAIPDNSVDCCITSPPYFQLRDYGVEGQIGMERTPAEWIAVMTSVFRDVRRVLAPHGTCWLNVGDKYLSDGGSGHQGNGNSCRAHRRHTQHNLATAPPSAFGLKAKDLALLPERLAIALQDDGWYVRQRCVWHKPSPMPESTKDRPTTDFEHVWMLTKSETYFYDAFAVMEATTGGAHLRGTGVNPKSIRSLVAPHRQMPRPRQNSSFSAAVNQPMATRNLRTVWRISASPFADEMCLACGRYYDAREKRQLARTDENALVCRCGKSDAWLAHFATFPPALPELCIRASTSEMGCCAWCGKPIERIVRRPRVGDWNPDGGRHDGADVARMRRGAKRNYGGKNLGMVEQDKSRQMQVSLASARAAGAPHDAPFPAPEHVGWRPCCPMNTEQLRRPAVVLDPFAGAATTLIAAERMGRDAIGLELNADYVRMARERIRRARRQTPSEPDRDPTLELARPV